MLFAAFVSGQSSRIRARRSLFSTMFAGLPVVAAVIMGMLWLGTQAGAQCTNLCLAQTTCSTPGETTSISGTVYAPNGTDPLPNVLVYVPNSAVASFTPGVACELAGESVSGSPLVSTTTAIDGTFTLTNMPATTNVPLVIQAGKWRRQISIPTVTACANTAIDASLSRMPRNHEEGDIPLTAIVTGSVDATECALRKIGIADSEFTNPPSQGGSGRINFYLGNSAFGAAGAQIDAHTPTEDQLEGTQASLNQYDLVMFACQGDPYTESTALKQNLVNYANAGGRVYATHYAYAWLYDYAPFSETAAWKADPDDTNTFLDDPGTGLINTSFPEGQELAQWLHLLYPSSTLGQVQINTLRHDFIGVIAPSELWLSDNDPTLGTVPMQYTFNTPVGSSAANQCGRVVFNDYHVEDIEDTPSGGMTFPNECAGGAMTPQEKMLEFTLFDLTSFLSPDIPPTITVGFVNAPTSFKQGDSSDTVTITVTNTSTQTDASATLTTTVTLPAGLTALTMTDSDGGWVCNVGTLTCARSSALTKGTADSIVLTVSVASGATSGSVGAVLSGGGLASSVSGSDALTIEPASYCTVDANCAAGNWCNESTNTCTPQLPNGVPLPTDPAHTNPTLGGMCTQAAGALVCVSGVCDTDNKCGYAIGDGPCTPTGSAVCRSGACSTTDVCEPASGCDVDLDCSAGHVCSSHTCVSGCDISGVVYSAGAPNPASACLVCTPATSTTTWSDAVNGTTCNDGNACTLTDVCQSGICVGSNPVTCTALDQCHTAGTCDTTTGACSNPALPNGTSCNDGNACTQSDVCQAGTCTGTNPVTCTPEDACHVAGSCNPSNGTCSNPTAPDGTSCGSGLVCMSGTCEAAQVVLTTAANPTAGGTVTPVSGGLYNQGTSVPITATANAGYSFLSWSSTGPLGSATSPSTTIFMKMAESVTAQFSANLVVNTANDDAGDASNCTAQTTLGTNTTDSACSLRDALLFAANVGAANITFDSTTFSASHTTAQNTITLGAAGALNIPTNTSITGPTTGSGATPLDLVTVDGNGASSVFILSTGSASISGLAITGGSAANGGGIFNGGALTLSNSTLFGNSATNGGAIYDGGNALTVTNTTFANNSATTAGGGIWTNSGAAAVTNSTLSGNSSSGQNGTGGGIFVQSGTLALANSIVSGNTAPSNPDIDGNYKDQGGNVVDGSANLSALGNYGGATQTMLPLPGSPAICAGVLDNATGAGLTSDQRGLGFDLNCPKGSIDSGAVQSSYALSFTTSPNDTVAGKSLAPSPVVTLSESGTPLIAGAVSVAITAQTGTLAGTATVSTSTTSGAATFGGLSITPAESADELTATVALTNSINLTANSSPFNVTAAVAPTLTLSASPSTSVSVGTSVTFTATLHNVGPSPAPSGTVTFIINGNSNSDCPAVPVSALGTATCTTASLLAPADAITATYSGDPNYTVANPAMLTENVSKATAQTQLAALPVSPFVNQLVTFTATVLAPGGSNAEVQPSGNVTFKQGGTTLCGATGINPNTQTATCSYAFASAASGITITATYGGDQNFAAGAPGSTQVSVAATATTTSLISTPNPSAVNQPVIFKATVTPAYTAGGAVPAGTVVYTNTSTSTQMCSVTLSNGVVPVCKYAFAAQGSDNVTATYISGDSNFSGSSSGADDQGVGTAATSVTLTSSPLPSSVGQPVTITAVVGYFGSGATKPTGNITFTDTLNNSVLCAPDVLLKTSGSLVSATCTTTFTTAATHPISAAYNGDANFKNSTSVLLYQVVSPSPETIKWPTPNSITFGTLLGSKQLDATANIAGTFAYSPLAGTVLGAGLQTLSVTFTPNDTTDYSVKTVFVKLQVNKATPVIAWDPASIVKGAALGAAQLDATAKVPGLFTYKPHSGTVVNTLTEKLEVLFTPNDITDYNTASKTVSLKVIDGPLLKVSPLSINYGTVKLHSVTVKNVTLTNLGTVPVTIQDPFFSIVDAGSSNEFVAVNLCPKSLPGQKSCEIRVAFVAGAFYTPQKATLNVTDDAPGSPQKVTLTAQVKKP